MSKIKVQMIKSKIYGIEIEEIEYENVERIIFDCQFKDEKHPTEPCFIIVIKQLDKYGNSERKTATFWCENTQIKTEE